MKTKKHIRKIILSAAILLLCVNSVFAARIKDLATVEGVTGVQVIGYGLVTGLNNTGDNQRSTFTVQSVTNMLKRFGLTVPVANPRIRNVAAVMVTSTIPSSMKKGAKIDIHVSSIGDASSLQGGMLIMSPVSLADGKIVGMAQGPVTVGGYDFQSIGTRIAKNFVTTGRVANGLILQTDISAEFVVEDKLRIFLRDPDFTTIINMAEAITASNPNLKAVPLDAGTIEIELPTGQDQFQKMKLISDIEKLDIESDPVARVVINERTGTIVVGGNVTLSPCVISHGGLEIQIQRQVIVPQPAPFTIRPPTPVESATISATEELNPATVLTVENPNVEDMAAALNGLKVKPRDLIAIFQALKEVGALQGELIIQ